MEVGRQFFDEARITPVGSFEEGAKLVNAGAVDVVLVPAAYPSLSGLIMGRNLRATCVFINPIVPLVYVISPATQLSTISRLYLHPATDALVEEASVRSDLERVYCSSNTLACQRASVDPTSAAITNLPSAQHFGMHVLKQLRDAVSMPWILFCRADRILDQQLRREA